MPKKQLYLFATLSMKKPKGTFISFIGSRGSGKSTVAQDVCAELQQTGKTHTRQHVGLSRKPLWRGVGTAIYLWRFFDFNLFRFLGFTGRKRRLFPTLYQLYLPLAFACDLHEITSGKSEVLVYDSNILRGLMAALGNGDINEAELVDFYKNSIAARVAHVVLVVVETDPKEAVRRWVERDSVTLSQDEYATAIEEWEATERLAKNAITALERIGNVSIITLNGEEESMGNAMRVVNYMNSLSR